MIRRVFASLDPYVLALLATVLIASAFPATGQMAVLLDTITDVAITLLFFLHGARLSRRAIIDGMRNLKLQFGVLSITFVAFPLLGIGVRALNILDPSLGDGVLFLTLLPSTVQSSIAFTAVARGNVAAAVCSASISNLAGIFITPALVALLLHASGEIDALASMQKIILHLMVPFVIGHLMQPLIGPTVTRHKQIATLVDRGSILLVVYTSFAAAVTQNLWQQVRPADFLALLGVSTCMLAAILALSWWAATLLDLNREDRIVLQFCGSKKSLATGVPMAGVLFAPAQVGPIILPLMLFHQLQLIVCAALAQRYGRDDAPPAHLAA